ncbi:MAG: prepilin peptidase [Geminicoccaceae bacterium]|nr:prepilin peptidase [Geminicoccaceae bacterium]
MSSASTLPVLAPLLAVLCWVAWTDLRARRIANTAVVALLALWPLHLLLLDQPSPWWSGPAAGFLLLGGGLVLWHLRLLGGGDVKLAAALACFVGLDGVGAFLLDTALLGGLLAVLALAADRAAPMLAMLVARLAPAPLTGRLAAALPTAVPSEPTTVPYGIAIAGAGALAILRPSLVAG